jgi:transposase-like protein
MKRRRHTPEQIVRLLAEGEKLLGEGQALEAVTRHLEITESTWHRWRNQYGGMKADDARELRELRKENQRLKKIVADLTLDNDMLKELNRGNY